MLTWFLSTAKNQMCLYLYPWHYSDKKQTHNILLSMSRDGTKYQKHMMKSLAHAFSYSDKFYYLEDCITLWWESNYPFTNVLQFFKLELMLKTQWHLKLFPNKTDAQYTILVDIILITEPFNNDDILLYSLDLIVKQVYNVIVFIKAK